MKVNKLFKVVAFLVVTGILLALNVSLLVRDTFMEQEWLAVLAIYLIATVSFLMFVVNNSPSEEERLADEIDACLALSAYFQAEALKKIPTTVHKLG